MKIRYAFFLLIVALLFGLSLPAQSVEGASPPESRERLVLTHSATSAPWSYLDESGRPAGILIDFWKLWSEKTGVEVDFKLADLQQDYEMLKKGQADVFAGSFDTLVRLKDYEYSKEFLTINICVFVSQEVEAKNIVELKGLEVGVIAGEQIVTFLSENYPFLKFHQFENESDMFAAVARGALSVFVRERAIAQYDLIRSGQLGHFRVLDELYTGGIMAAMPKPNLGLLELVNSGIDRISDKEIEGIYDRWSMPKSYLPEWLVTLLFAGGLGLLLFFIGIHLFVSWLRIRHRTAHLQWKLDEARFQIRRLEHELERVRKSLEETRRTGDWKDPLAEQSENIIGTMDVYGHITYVNHAGLDKAGLKAEDVLGRHYREFVKNGANGASAQFAKRAAEAIRNNGSCDIAVRTGSGHALSLKVKTTQIEGRGKPSGYIFIGREIPSAE